MANEGVEVEIYRFNDPLTKAAVLHNTINPQITCEIGDGAGSLTGFNLDPEIVRDPTLLDYLNIVKMRIDGVIRQAWIIQKKGNKDLEATRADEHKELSGAGLRQWLNDAVVKPYGGLKQWSHDNRFFNFATERGAWYIDADWQAVHDAGQVHVTPDKIPQPTDWPDWASNAHWLWGVDQPGGATPNLTTTYFRREFTIAEGAGGNYRLYCAGDDSISAWLDGEQLVSNNPATGAADNQGAFQTSTKVDFTLSEGPHVMAFSTENLYFGPAGTLAAVCQVTTNADGSSSEVPLWVSDMNTNWKCLYNPSKVPGWSAGEIILTLFNEAKDRGVANFDVMTPTWTASHDSIGNAWTDTYDWSFPIGNTYYSVIQQLEELVCNLTIDPDTYDVNLVPNIGVDRTTYRYDVDGVTVLQSPVIFRRGKNLTSAETEGTAKLVNSLMIKTDNGWLESDVTNDPSLTKYGKKEATLNTGASPDISNDLAQVIFQHKADPEEGATYEFIPTPGATPFTDFGVGDWVLAPKDTEELVSRRVMSISATRLNAGKVGWTVEFDTIFQEDDVRINNILNKTGNGGVGSGFANAQGNGSTPITPVSPPVGPPIIRVPKPPTDLSAVSSGKWSADGVTPISEVTLTWTPTSQNTDNTEAIPKFYEVWAHPASMDDSAYQQYAIVTSPSAVMDLTPGISWVFKVRTLTESSRPSAFSSEYTYTTESPNQPMDPPSTPTLSSDKGLLVVTWDGKLGANDPPPQFRFVYAQVSPSGAGTWSRMGAVLQRGGGSINIPNLTIGSEYDARLIAVDGVGIASSASEIASISITGIDLGDLDSEVTDAINAAEQAAINASVTDNLAMDPSFEDEPLHWWSIVTPTEVTQDGDDPHLGGNSIRMANSASLASYIALQGLFDIPLTSGSSYIIWAWIKLEAGTAIDNGVEITITWVEPDGTTTHTESVANSPSLIDTTNYLRFSGVWVVPETAVSMRIQITRLDNNPSNIYLLDDIAIYQQANADLIADGGITTDKLVAEAITAGKIAAGAISADTIQSGAITAGKIAAGAVTADAIAASSISGDKIVAGSIEATSLSPSVGNSIDISANESVTIMAGTINDVQGDVNDTQSNLTEMQTYYTFGPDGAIVSKPGSPFALALRSDRIEMLENGNVVSYWTSGQMYVNDFIGTKVVLGNHQIEQYSSGTVVRQLS